MKNIKIFVEGKTDKTFVLDFLKIKFNVNLDRSNVIDVEGKDKINLAVNIFRQTSDSGGTNIVLFDADDSPAKRRIEIEKKKQELGISFELFLFPDNSSSGELETLLCELINPEHSRVLDCFSSYESCLKQYHDSYDLPAVKGKLYAYLDAVLEKGDKKMISDDKRDYSMQKYWNLNSDFVKPLTEFLGNYI